VPVFKTGRLWLNRAIHARSAPPFRALHAGVSCGTMDAAAVDTHPSTRPIYREPDAATGRPTSRSVRLPPD